MEDEKAKFFLAVIVAGVLLLVAVMITTINTVEHDTREEVYAEVAQEPIRQFVTNRMCQFVQPPAQEQGQWAACNDGTTWGVVPLEAGR